MLVEKADINGIARKEVRKNLLNTGHTSITIRNVLRTLANEHRCIFMVNSRSKYQLLTPLKNKIMIFTCIAAGGFFYRRYNVKARCTLTGSPRFHIVQFLVDFFLVFTVVSPPQSKAPAVLHMRVLCIRKNCDLNLSFWVPFYIFPGSVFARKRPYSRTAIVFT